MEKGYMPATQFVEGEFRVDSSDSRNRNFIVNRDYDNSYFIKHIKAADFEKTSTIRTEATCYWLANNDDNYKALNSYLPRYYDFDYNNYILVLGYEKGNINLLDFFFRHEISPGAIAAKCGTILSSYHSGVSHNLMKGDTTKFFKKIKPWVFGLGQPSKLKMGQTAGDQLIKLIAEDTRYVAMIGALEHAWQFSSLIHSDIKFQNFLINSDYNGSNELLIKLIDWELSDIGDPCWDVAGIFQSYLCLWVNSEVNKGSNKDFKLHQIQPLIASFWNAYATGMNFSASEKQEQLLKCINFCALKLIHTAFETTPGSPSLSPYAAKLLQLSANILNAPQTAQHNRRSDRPGFGDLGPSRYSLPGLHNNQQCKQWDTSNLNG
jgi:serine/threonine protein kinase